MKRFLLFCLFVLAAVPRPALAGTGAAWLSWDEGIRQAQATGRPVLVDVYTDWCGWCKRMDREVYARRDIQAYLSGRFVTVRLNAESGAPASYEGHSWTSRGLAQHFGVSGYPTTMFLAASGAHLGSVPGYLPADRFLSLLHYIGDGYMERGVSFEDYQRGAGAASRGSGRKP